MRIFVSWSGATSQKIAELIRDWVPNVVQQTDLFVSSQDIAKGTRGLEAIGQNLEGTDFGIVVLTSDNVSAPWINFEAGALSKSISRSHVVPLLCGIREINLPNSPLRQFQHAKADDSNEMLRVILDINRNSEKPLLDEKATQAFHKWWPDFAERYQQIELKPAKEPKGDRSSSPEISDALNSIMADLAAMRREMYDQRRAMRKLSQLTMPKSEGFFGTGTSKSGFPGILSSFGPSSIDPRKVSDEDLAEIIQNYARQEEK